MEECLAKIAQAIQGGQLDPQMPIGQLLEMAAGGGQPPVAEPQGLGGPVPMGQPGM